MPLQTTHSTMAELEGRLYYGRTSGKSDTKHIHRTKEIDNNGQQEADSHKLGTFEGVFIPTTLNVLSILMFLRFGFILCQAGILGMFGLLLISYCIDLLTTLSVSAIATNGTVKGGGAYYMISRSLGPEFGGSIGLVFYIGQVLNAYVDFKIHLIGFNNVFLVV